MRNFRKHKTAIFLIGATLVIALLIGIFGAVASNETASVAENAVGATAEAGQAATSGIGGWFRNLFTYFGSVKALREEIAVLQKEKTELDKQVQDMKGMEEENKKLRAMLDLTEAEAKLDMVAARVIAKDPSNWYSSITINKGTKDGIAKNQAVFTGNGELIGQVYKVGSGWAEIITVLDPDSAVGSMVRRTKDIGVLEGDSSLRFQGLCVLGYLSRDAQIAVGDYVETSGMGGIYPKGLLIGKVTEVIEENATMSKYAKVEPLADIDKVTEVFVLRTFTEEIKSIADPKEMEEEKGQNAAGTSADSKDTSSKDSSESNQGDSSKTSAKTSGNSENSSTTDSGESGKTDAESSKKSGTSTSENKATTKKESEVTGMELMD